MTFFQIYRKRIYREDPVLKSDLIRRDGFSSYFPLFSQIYSKLSFPIYFLSLCLSPSFLSISLFLSLSLSLTLFFVSLSEKLYFLSPYMWNLFLSIILYPKCLYVFYSVQFSPETTSVWIRGWNCLPPPTSTIYIFSHSLFFIDKLDRVY